jgi:hypothetical protein
MEDTGGKARPEDLLSRNKTQVLGELEHEGKQVPLAMLGPATSTHQRQLNIICVKSYR